MNKFYEKYRRMSVLKKLTMWSSIVTFVGFGISLVSLSTNANNQSLENVSVGNNSTIVNGTMSGDININSDKSKHYQFNKSNYLISKPTLAVAGKQEYIICTVLEGEALSLTGNKVQENPVMEWFEVRPDSGDCKGQIGWILSGNLRLN